MNWLAKLREQKLLSITLMALTLGIGILIGTLITTGVSADKGGKAITDATPLSIPSPVTLANDFSNLAKKLEPTVVHVSTEYGAKPRTESRRRTRPQQEEEDEEGLDLFRFFRGNPMLPEDMPRQRRQGTGSGFIVDPKGYIITNHHVVDEADKITVRLHGDQTEYKAKLIGSDLETDLAVVKIDAGRSLPAAPVGNSDAVQVGDWAVAIGSPFGLEASVTAGIVSAKGRDINAQQFQRFIQTDAAINPGNSGGPLLNIRGEVIGVNTMIATRSGGYQGIGFALPINMAVKVYNQIIKTGHVTRGSIGISWSQPSQRKETLKSYGVDHGVIVDSVTKDGPAYKAGIKPDDIILAINGQAVKNGDDLVARVADTPVGEKVTLTVDREGKKMEVPIVVEDRYEVFKDDPRFAKMRRSPEETKEESTDAKFGIFVREMSAAEREEAKIEDNRGIVVTRVQEDSFAEELGLQEKDIILSVNRVPVRTVDDVRKIQASLKPGSAVSFRVARPVGIARSGRAAQYSTILLSGTLPQH